MIRETVVFWPHALLYFWGKENSFLHGEAKGFVVCLKSLQTFISDIDFSIILLLTTAVWAPDALL
jgi:hypothetical protein